MKTIIIAFLLIQQAHAQEPDTKREIDFFSHTKENENLRRSLKLWPEEPLDSTWCPIFQHWPTCTFRTGQWLKKEGMWRRMRICRNHHIKQYQYAKLSKGS